MKKIIIFLSLIFLSFTGIFIPSCFSDALYTLDGKGDIYMIDDQGRISGYKDGKLLEDIPGVSPYITMGGGSSEDWKQIYMPQRIDLKTVIVGKSDGTYNLMVAGGNYHLEIGGVETKKGQVDEIISRENRTEINFDDDKKGYYNLEMNSWNYKNGNIYFYQQEATGKYQKYLVDWDAVDKREENSTIYIVDNDNNSSNNSLNNSLNNEKENYEYNSIGIYGIILIFVVVLSIIGTLSYLYYKKKISKRLLLIILAFLLFFLVTFLVLHVNNNEKPEQNELLVKTDKCLKPKEIGTEYNGQGEYDIVNGKVLMMKSANNKKGYEVITTEIDPLTFRIIGNGYTKDKGNIYYAGEKINGIDYCSFEISIFGKNSQNPAGIARDKNSIYKAGKIIEEADLETFIKEGTSYFKDKNHIYNIKGDIIIGSDVETFTYYKKGNFFYDKNGIYYHGLNIAGADYATFEDTGYELFFKDKNNLYFKSDKIKGADPKTFEKISNWYYKDKNHIYTRKGKIIESIDVNSYDLVIKTQVLYDKNGLYLSSGKYFPGADVESFVPMKDLYYKDKNNIYYSNKLDESENEFEIINIKEADVESFTNVLSGEKSKSGNKDGLGYAKDKNNVYYKGIIIENSDPSKCENEEECFKNYPYN